ncbi:MAG TPA: porin [Archangium sp.]
MPAAAPPSDPVVVKIAMGKGITVSKGEALSMTVRARFQIRDVATIQDTAVSNEFSLRTARLFVHGKVLSPKLCYFVQLALGQNDFEAGITSPVFDAFVEWTGWRDLNIKAGQFFVPFDRARTIREVALQLVDRQQVITELGMDRDLGIALSSQDLFGWGGRLSYTLGLFGGQGKNRVLPEKNPGFLYTARVAFRPMGAFDDDVEADIERSVNPHLSVGLAFAYNQNTLRAKGVIGPIYTLKGFDQLHLAADVVFKWRGFSLLAEVIMRQANEPFHDGETASGAPLREWSRSGWGYLVQAGYMVTPNLEVAARWDQVRFISGDPALSQLAQQQGREFGAGLNWYFNGHLAKLQADYSIRFGDGSVPPTHMVRGVIDVSF